MHCTILNDIKKTAEGEIIINPPICIDNELGSPTFGQQVPCEECTSCKDIPIVTTTVDWRCNEETNVYDQVVVTTTNGVPGEEVVTPTETTCDIDIELSTVTECRNGVVTIVHYVLMEEDGAPEELLATPTPQVCTLVNSDIILDCEGTTETIEVDNRVSLAGAEVPIPVRLIEDCEIDVTFNTSFKCNSETGFYDQCVITITDGVPSEPVITATTISCENLPQSYEQVTYCDLDTETYHILTYEIIDGVSTLIDEIDTERVCIPTSLDLDFELLCNEETNVYDLHTFTIVDGTAGAPKITPTETPCDQNPPDFEKIKICSTETLTYHVQICSFDEAGVKTIVEEIDTGQSCEVVTQKFRDCGQQQFVESGLDNTFTHHNDTNQTLELTDSVGNITTVNIGGGFANFSDQIAAFATAVGGFLNTVQIGTFCTNGCGELPQPIVTVPKMKFRYVGYRTCPGDPVLVQATYQSDQRKKRNLDVASVETELTIHNYCTDCEGNIEWEGEPPVLDEAGNPICFLLCVKDFPETPEPLCPTTIDGPFCDLVFVEDPDAENTDVECETVAEGIFRSIDCEGNIVYAIEEDGALFPYEVQGEIGLCEGCVVVKPELPVPDCGAYTGRKKCFENKGRFKLIETQFDPTITGTQTVDVSADLGLAPGSVVATLDTQLWAGGAGTIVAVSVDNTATFSVSGSQPVCIRVVHGGAIPLDGGQDCFTSNDGVPYTFVGNLTDSAATFTEGTSGCVTSSTNNIVGGIRWESQGAATSVTMSTTNTSAFNSVRFFVATVDCIEVREWISCDKTICHWYDGKDIIDITELEEKECPGDGNGLSEFKTPCSTNASGIPDANYNGAIAITTGRPLPTVPWSLIDNTDPNNQVAVASGATFQEFSEALEAAGYTEFIEGEIHYICPCPPNLVNAGDYFITADGDTVVKPLCTPKEELPNHPCEPVESEENYALKTLGCNDDRRDGLLQNIADSLEAEECCIPPDGENRDRWCQRYDAEFPIGTGSGDEILSVGVGGVWEELPNPYTDEDFLAALNGLAPNAGWTLSEAASGQTFLCRYDGPGAVSTRRSICTGKVCQIGTATGVSLFTSGDDPTCNTYIRTWGKYEEPIAGLLQNIDSTLQNDVTGDSCETPMFTKECPPEPCPPANEEVYCDENGTKYVIVEYATELCGVSGTFLAEPYFNGTQTIYEPVGPQQLCEDATIKEQECVVDECGTRWSCVTVITPVGGTVTESQTCVPYTNPECGEAEGAVRKEVAKKTVKALNQVKSAKLAVATVNTAIVESTDETGERAVPVGETCPCKEVRSAIVKGCIEGGVEAFTYVDTFGNALFPPKPLSDLGFVDCCVPTELPE